MLRKLEKLRRYLRWRLKPVANTPMFWHVGRPNFGDDVNPTFLQRLGGSSLRLAIDQEQPHLLGVGSILEFATPQSVVLGAGYLRPDSGPVPEGTAIVSLRGELSQRQARCRADILLGDPLVLVDQLVQRSTLRHHRIGFVAHVLNVSEMRARFGKEVHLINPAWDPWRVIEEISTCELVASQSLHGLIVADALQIPNLWIAPSKSMAGGRFKFDDYFSTLEEPKEPIAAASEVFRYPTRYPFSVCNYRYSKHAYAKALTTAIGNFPNSQERVVRAAA